MNRRAFVGGLTWTLAAGPLEAATQPTGRPPRIGLLDYTVFWTPFIQELRDLGYVEGQSIALEYRPSDGQYEKLPALARELARINVNVIVAYGTPATLAAKQATTTIPVVMVAIGDPLKTGLVASVARPCGNVTGNTMLGPEISTKRLALLIEAIPKVSRIAYLWNPRNASNEVSIHVMQDGARALGVTLQLVEVSNPNQLDGTFTTMMRQHPDALLVTGDLMHQVHFTQIVNFANRNRIPTMSQIRDDVEAGGLMSYGASRTELLRRAAIYVDKILKGTTPANLPVEQPTKFELVINKKTAQALGLTIPQSILLQADHVIE